MKWASLTRLRWEDGKQHETEIDVNLDLVVTLETVEFGSTPATEVRMARGHYIVIKETRDQIRAMMRLPEVYAL